MPSNEKIEALLRAADAMGHEHYCNRIVGGKCECNVRELDEAAAAVRAELAREPAGYSDEGLARLMHETYERLAPKYGYETRPDTRQFDPTTPNGQLMIAVARHVRMAAREPVELTREDHLRLMDEAGVCRVCDPPIVDTDLEDVLAYGRAVARAARGEKP